MEIGHVRVISRHYEASKGIIMENLFQILDKYCKHVQTSSKQLAVVLEMQNHSKYWRNLVEYLRPYAYETSKGIIMEIP